MAGIYRQAVILFEETSDTEYQDTTEDREMLHKIINMILKYGYNQTLLLLIENIR